MTEYIEYDAASSSNVDQKYNEISYSYAVQQDMYMRKILSNYLWQLIF